MSKRFVNVVNVITGEVRWFTGETRRWAPGRQLAGYCIEGGWFPVIDTSCWLEHWFTGSVWIATANTGKLKKGNCFVVDHSERITLPTPGGADSRTVWNVDLVLDNKTERLVLSHGILGRDSVACILPRQVPTDVIVEQVLKQREEYANPEPQPEPEPQRRRDPYLAHRAERARKYGAGRIEPEDNARLVVERPIEAQAQPQPKKPPPDLGWYPHDEGVL